MKRPPEELAEKLLAVSDQLSGTDLDVSVDDIAKMAGLLLPGPGFHGRR